MIWAVFTLALCAQGIEVVDTESALVLEQQVAKALAIAAPATVGLEMRNERGATSGSGTIINKDGWILTAGHVAGEAGVPVQIYFPDGSSAEGKTVGLHWNGREDCGVVRFDPGARELSVAAMGEAKDVHVGDWVLALGHTYGIEKNPFRPPVLRFGRVRLVDGKSINMDAPLSSGDSGGGLFDLEGRLIGVNSTAGSEPEWNTAVNIDFVKSHLSDMMQGAVTGASADAYRKGEDASKPNATPAHDPEDMGHAKADPELLLALAPAVDEAILMTVGVFVDGRQVGLGTVASAEGHVIAKASDVGSTSDDVSVALPDGLMVSVKRMAMDGEHDLVLLETGEAFDEPVFASDYVVPQGAILLSAGRDLRPMACGVRSLGEYLPGRSDVTAAFLGIGARSATPEERTKAGADCGVIVMAVSAGSPAARAGLARGDFLSSIDGKNVSDQAAVGESIRRHASGDVIDVTRMKEGVAEIVRARLMPRRRDAGPSPSSPKYPASRRSSGFGKVIQHDSALRADQMGGPVTTLDGKVIGVNIARVDRTKTYALSAATVKEAIVKLLAQAAESTGPLPLVNPLDTGVVTKQTGATIRLDANAAEVLGSTLRYEQDEDELAHLERWVDANDAARWVVEFTKPGDYAIKVVQACPADAAGQDFEVRVGEIKLRSTTKATDGWSQYSSVDVGSIHVEEPGRAIIEIGTGGQLRAPLMHLHAIELKRTS